MDDIQKSSNLPVVQKETIFTKIKNWFKNIFGINKEQNIVPEAINTINENIKEMEKTSFIESIKVESKDKILSLQRKLKEKQIEISSLTDEELDEMIELYKNTIQEKRLKLYRLKNKKNN